MKKVLFVFILSIVSFLHCEAQITSQLTVFRDFQPAIIHLSDGRTITQPLTNIFLKNGALLYKRGTQTMQANMRTVVSVEFQERSYIKIDTLLAWMVDSVGDNRIYQATLIDRDAYDNLLKNSTEITSLSLGDNMSYSSIDLLPDDDRTLPVVNHYFFLYNGKILRVHERTLWHAIPKEKRRMFKTIVGQPTFSWTDKASLKQLLSVI